MLLPKKFITCRGYTGS